MARYTILTRAVIMWHIYERTFVEISGELSTCAKGYLLQIFHQRVHCNDANFELKVIRFCFNFASVDVLPSLNRSAMLLLFMEVVHRLNAAASNSF